MSDTPKPRVSIGEALASPFLSVTRDFRQMLDQPRAFVGGIVGTVLMCGSLVLFSVYAPQMANAEEPEEEFELEFEPGTLVRLGPKPEELPEKIIVQETVAREKTEMESLTEKDEPPPKKKEKKKKKDEKKSKEDPDPNKKDAPEAEKNTESNTEFKDELPTMDELPGDPFGDPQGWDKLKKDGDPWATSVMAALNAMKPPAYAASATTPSAYKFKLTVCKDGTVKKVANKGSSGDVKVDDAIKGELLRLAIPKPPKHIADQMKSNCVSLKYNFSWKSGKVR